MDKEKSKKKKVIIIVIAILCVAAVIGFVITKIVTTPKVEIDYGTSDIYTQKDMDDFIKHPNVRFLKDNITLATQYKFDIRYDTKTNRIVVPWYDKNGVLVGATGRYNFNDLGSNPKCRRNEGGGTPYVPGTDNAYGVCSNPAQHSGGNGDGACVCQCGH